VSDSPYRQSDGNERSFPGLSFSLQIAPLAGPEVMRRGAGFDTNQARRQRQDVAPLQLAADNRLATLALIVTARQFRGNASAITLVSTEPILR
jgi:hypothetical protein